eukprot:m.218215 g.218215  ORF g.218215 m.218215 type:complete len:288 (+) comp17216_c1_seq4:853-1716(+)
MEITPKYFYLRHVPYSMIRIMGQKQLSSTRFVLFLRNGAKRAFSGSFEMGMLKHNWTVDNFVAETPLALQHIKDCYSQSLALGPPSLAFSNASADAYLVFNTSSKQLFRRTSRPHHPDLKLLAACVDPVVQLKRMATCLDTWEWMEPSVLCNNNTSEKPCMIPVQYDSPVDRSLYVDQLRNWLCAGVQPQQILIRSTTAAWRNPNATLQRIADWMGRGSSYMTPNLAQQLGIGVHNKSQSAGREYPSATMAQIRTFIQPYDDALLELLGTLPFDVNVTEVASELRQP